MASWSERYVDGQVDEAWRHLRLSLAERFVASREAGIADVVDFVHGDADALTVRLDGDRIVVAAGEWSRTFGNVDEAAYRIVTILREQWQVIHPAFVSSNAIAPARADDAPRTVARAPGHGTPASTEQLRTWVVETFDAGREEPIRVGPDGSIRWRSAAGGRVRVVVRNRWRIDLVAQLGKDVSRARAHAFIDDASARAVGLKFFLRERRLLMSMTVLADPFCPEQLTNALASFLVELDGYAWVSSAVRRRRAAVDREALAVAEAEVARLRKALKRARRKASRRARPA
ncbi:MAG: hypothetical protein QM572_10030 [Nocardioides sp.]|uniref:T3SS (YopN, CesT) and YbjN peptide-binding chaperone 1 n=1 Tax=Nocardioides sp. TaxID=35761 RepID=UPI0039E70B0B